MKLSPFLILVGLFLAIAACHSPDLSENQKNIQNSITDTIPRVTGIGGIFFESSKPDEATQWYQDNLGIKMDLYGAVFEFRNSHHPDEQNYLRWSVFDTNAAYFKPSGKGYMINYRVNNLDGLLKILRQKNVTILDEVSSVDYGKFVHILDPEGNKIELWEPVDSVLTKMGSITNK